MHLGGIHRCVPLVHCCPEQILWSRITLYRACTCTSCLARQHFDYNSAYWYSDNVSSSRYLRTVGKEFNRSFQQTFVEQERLTTILIRVF